MHLTADKGLAGMGQGLHYSGLFPFLLCDSTPSCVLAQQGSQGPPCTCPVAPAAAAATQAASCLVIQGLSAICQHNLAQVALFPPCAGCGCPKDWIAGTRPSDVVDLLVEQTFSNYQSHNLVGRRKMNVVYML